MRFNVCFATLLGVSALASVGCTAAHKGSDSTTDDPASLDAQNGALDVQSSEAPAFGDAEMASLADLDPAAEGTDDATALAAAAPNATSYHVLLVWGHLPQAHDADDADPAPVAEDWSGSISVDQGAIGLKRTLAFDAADAIAPRTDKASLAFTSHTLPAVDGVLVRVVVPSGGKPTLHFATSALTTDIDLHKAIDQRRRDPTTHGR